MAENLTGAATILLFGRVVEDISINAARGSKRGSKGASSGQLGAGHALAQQMAAEGSCLARIYAFSYEGNYYDLARPTLYLVHGPGESLAEKLSIEQNGIAATPDKFATDLRVWAYEKADMSIRLDVETGMLEQILLEAELNPESRAQYSGQFTRSGQFSRSGQFARAGQFARSGQFARIRGGGGSNSD